MKNYRIVTPAVLILSIFAGACSKEYVTNIASPVTTLTSENSELSSSVSDLESWKKLVLSDEKNIALAEILSKSVAVQNKALIKELVLSLNQDEINLIISQVQNEQNAFRKSLLFRNNLHLEGTEIYRQSILAEDYKVSPDAGQLALTTFSYLKSKSLDEITKSYDSIIAENSRDVARAMIVDIEKTNGNLSKEIEKAASTSFNAQEFGEKIKKSTDYLAKADEFFQHSGLNTKEQVAVLVTGAVSAAIYLEIKETKTFKNALLKYEKAKIIIADVKEKVKLLKLSASVIKSNKDLMIASQKELVSGLQGVHQGIEQTFGSIKDGATSTESINSKKTLNFLYDKVIKGKELDPKQSNPSILAAQKIINENLTKSFKAAGTMADSLSNIISATNLMSEKLGIKLPEGLQKTLQTASKVAAGVKIAASVAQGFMTGGVLTAMGALSSGPLAGMMGGGGPDPLMMAALGRIEAKLDVVLENQQQIMKMQLETIKMIKNLAIMIDEYHQQEMIALAALHDDVMVTTEITRAIRNTNINRCEGLIDFELRKTWKENKRNSFNAITTSEIDFDKFYSNLKSLNDFRRFARGTTSNDYVLCQEGLSEAFGNISSENNPILSVYNSTDNNNLFAFQRDIYKPLATLFEKSFEASRKEKNILHIPMARITSLDSKQSNLKEKDALAIESMSSDYNLENLLSAKALEKYLSSYLILYPVFEFDKEDWNKTLPEMVEIYFKNMIPNDGIMISGSNVANVSRGYYFMSNALALIQSAIAQESILAGESLIPAIHQTLEKDVLKTGECSSDVLCAIRSNKLLMRNYLVYLLIVNSRYQFSLEEYRAFYKQKDLSKIAEYMRLTGENINLLKVNSSNSDIILSLKGTIGKTIEIKMPSPEDLAEGQMLYSENMPRLLKMQKDVISALVKLSPSQFRTVSDRVGLANLLLLKNY